MDCAQRVLNSPPNVFIETNAGAEENSIESINRARCAYPQPRYTDWTLYSGHSHPTQRPSQLFLTKLYSNVITDAAVATCTVVWYSCQFVGFVFFELSPPVNFYTEYTSCFVIIVSNIILKHLNVIFETRFDERLIYFYKNVWWSQKNIF